MFSRCHGLGIRDHESLSVSGDMKASDEQILPSRACRWCVNFSRHWSAMDPSGLSPTSASGEIFSMSGHSSEDGMSSSHPKSVGALNISRPKKWGICQDN